MVAKPVLNLAERETLMLKKLVVIVSLLLVLVAGIAIVPQGKALADSRSQVTITHGSLVRDMNGRIVAATGILPKNAPASPAMKRHASVSVGSTSGSAPSNNVHPMTPCYSYWSWVKITVMDNGTRDSYFETVAYASCNGYPPEVQGYVANCAGLNETYNNDVWLAQSTVPGGQRLAESGRTGYRTYTSQCSYQMMADVLGYGQIWTSPLWGCGWYYWQNYNYSYDYLCTSTNIQ